MKYINNNNNMLYIPGTPVSRRNAKTEVKKGQLIPQTK